MNETKLENGPAAASEGIDKTAGTSVFINSKKENIFKPIQAVSGVVQRKQPLPVLSNILFVQKGKQVTLVANDLDLQILTVAEIGEENYDDFSKKADGYSGDASRHQSAFFLKER